jgi:hypothetical protein
MTTATKEPKATKPPMDLPAPASKPRRVGMSVEDKILEMLDLKEQIKAMYAEIDDIEGELIEAMPVGEPRKLSDGRTVMLQDNFAGGNVCYRPAAVRQFEVVVKK